MLLGSVVLEVAFGMIFVYLLLSLLRSAVGEYIEAKSNNRAKCLRLTGFAISQGSPFWFDLLNRFMVVRSTVKPIEKSQSKG